MKFFPAWFVIAALPSLAADPQLTAPVMPLPGAEAPAKGDKESGRFVFSLAPKSLQREPLLDFNVLTEMTAEGKARAQPTAEAPQYCLIEGGGMKEAGDVAGTVKPPPAEAVRAMVTRALAKRNYLEAAEAGPKPSLAIIYHWGVHESPARDPGLEMGPTPEPDASGQTPTAAPPPTDGSAIDMMPRVLGDVRKRKILIDRAALVGGMKFAMELNAVMNEEAAFRRANDATRSLGTGPLMDPNGIASPFYRFSVRDAKTARLVEEAFGGLFFVIISAFDYASVAASKPILLWRTKMSVNSSGVSLVETIQPMIVAGRDFIGKETDGGILIARKISRTGTVKIGEAEVEEYLDGDAATQKNQKPAEPVKK
jgi:hypothetical protein